MRQFLIAVSLLLFNQFADAQLKTLTMEDAMLKARTTLAPENLRQLQFLNGSNDYVYLKKSGNDEYWVNGSFTAPEQPYLTLVQLNAKLRACGTDTADKMPAIRFTDKGWILVLKGRKLSLDPVTGNCRVLLDKKQVAQTVAEESTAGYVAYVDGHNLFVSKDTDIKQVTTDGSEDIVYASSVHRDEFGITKGTFWSNNGQKLAFYRMDQSMVADYPIIDWSQAPAKNHDIKYPMAGGKSHHVTVGIYDPVATKLIYIKTGEPAEQYLTNIAWSPDDRYLFIAIVNREQNHVWLNQYDASSGDFVKTILEETNDKYTEPLVPMLFVKNKPDQFIWQSNRDGWNHLYHYDLTGKLIRQLTRGTWEVTEVKGFDPKGTGLFYMSTEESPVTRNLYLLDLKSGKSKRLTRDSAVHFVQVSNDGSGLLDVFSTIDNPRTIQYTDIKSGKTKLLLQAANPLAGYATGTLNLFSIRGNSGADLYCRMYKPVGFDSLKKYPVIVYWYGGPHLQMNMNAWNGSSGDYWFQYMAERGYVCFTIDPRGSDNRGREFEQSMFRHLGDVQMEDLMTAVDYLKRQTYVDDSRMGLFGWSFGGFATTDFMLTHPGIFKAAVAGGPVINWQWYEVMYTERYMDTPKENPEGYASTDLTKKVQQLKGKLLLIHGLQDPTVVQQHSVNFVRAAIDKGVQVDYMIYPGHEHNVIGKDRAHLYQKVTDYLEQYLK